MKKSAILLIIILAAACSTVEIPSDYGPPSKVYFCPKDDCIAKLNHEFQGAQVFVHCAFYDIDENLLKGILSKKLDIKIVAESDNINYKSPKIRYDPKNSTMHNKFCIIDNNKVITGSLNPTKNGLEKNQNNMIIINSYYLARNYEEEFQEMWSGAYSGGKKTIYPEINHNNRKIENLFCPEDNCKGSVLKEIINADESAYFMIFSFTDEDIADSLLYTDAEVKGIFDKVQSYSKYSQYKRMKDFGLDVELYNGTGFLHHKVLIIDKDTVITGSFNPTWSGSSSNDENILIIKDRRIAEIYMKEFERLTRKNTR